MKARNLSPDASTVLKVMDLLSKDENYHECVKLLPSFTTRANTEVDMINASCHLAEENFSRLTEPWPAAVVPSD